MSNTILKIKNSTSTLKLIINLLNKKFDIDVVIIIINDFLDCIEPRFWFYENINSDSFNCNFLKLVFNYDHQLNVDENTIVLNELIYKKIGHFYIINIYNITEASNCYLNSKISKYLKRNDVLNFIKNKYNNYFDKKITNYINDIFPLLTLVERKMLVETLIIFHISKISYSFDIFEKNIIYRTDNFHELFKNVFPPNTILYGTRDINSKNNIITKYIL